MHFHRPLLYIFNCFRWKSFSRRDILALREKRCAMIDLEKLEQYRENKSIEAKRAVGGRAHSVWET